MKLPLKSQTMVAPVWTSIAPSARMDPAPSMVNVRPLSTVNMGALVTPAAGSKISHKEGIGYSIEAAADDDGFTERAKKAASPEPGGPFGPPSARTATSWPVLTKDCRQWRQSRCNWSWYALLPQIRAPPRTTPAWRYSRHERGLPDVRAEARHDWKAAQKPLRLQAASLGFYQEFGPVSQCPRLVAGLNATPAARRRYWMPSGALRWNGAIRLILSVLDRAEIGQSVCHGDQDHLGPFR